MRIAGIDWLCVSPKAGAALRQRSGHELKLVYPQAGIDPAELLSLQFDHFWLQPMDGPDRAANTAAAIDYCLVASELAIERADAQARRNSIILET